MTAMVRDVLSPQSLLAERALASWAAPSRSDELVVADERDEDVGGREALLDAAFGAGRGKKSSEILRAGRLPAQGLSLVAREGGRIVGTVRLWHIEAGGVPALMLGPLAVAESHRSLGVGARLMREAIWRAAQRGHKAIVLVGDAPYYARYGFEAGLTAKLDWPGEVDRARLLAFEIAPGALDAARGMVRGTGATMLRPLQPRKRTARGTRKAA